MPLLVTVMPYLYNDAERKIYDELGGRAVAEGMGYLSPDELWQGSQIDVDKDFHDMGHENYSGACKSTQFFGRYLRAHYPQLGDYRSDTSGKYESFREQAHNYLAWPSAAKLSKCKETTEYFSLLADLDASYAVLFAGEGTLLEKIPQETRLRLLELGLLDGENVVFQSTAKRGQETRQVQFGERLLTNLEGDKIAIDRLDGSKLPKGQYTTIRINDKVVSRQLSGLKLVVYDLYAHKVLDSIVINADGTMARTAPKTDKE